MNRFVAATVVALAAAMAGCHNAPPAHTQASDLGCAETIAAVDQMRRGLALPPYFSKKDAVKQGGEFDAGRYFDAFTRLKMRDGFVLDYVYHQDGMGGYPLLYARPAGQAPYVNETEYDAVPNRPDYLTFVEPEDSAEGYFEYAAFAATARQFYLDWHANYNDWRVVCGTDGVEEIIRELGGEDPLGKPMTAEQQEAARTISDPLPSVTMTDDTATVSMLVFTKWGGFYRRVLTIDRANHAIRDQRDEPLVEYDCGVAF